VLHDRFDGLKPGPFNKSFSDLARATRGREEEDFGTLAPHIYAEATKGDEAFDAFGVKFPSEQVTGWGIIILIAVQLYLVLYLRRLFNKLKPNDPGWDVPWMAMDYSLLARVMLFVSLVVLPVCAAVFVVVQSSVQIAPDGWTWHVVRIFWSLSTSGKLQLALMLLGFGVSLSLTARGASSDS
jgi:hypothetical protein